MKLTMAECLKSKIPEDQVTYDYYYWVPETEMKIDNIHFNSLQRITECY